MARSFAGGTDRIAYGSGAFVGAGAGGATAFWMKTTQVTSNTGVITMWGTATTSRQGMAFLLNNVANKISLDIEDSVGSVNNLASTTSVNDGNWHHIGANWNGGTTTPCAIFVDGVSEDSGTNSSNWNFGTKQVHMGDSSSSFWASYVGALAEFAFWSGTNLTQEEMTALANGFSPQLIAPSFLEIYSPLVRDPAHRVAAFPGTVTGTTVTDHPRIIGGII